jgi:FHS family L-fucose permease-like MFS transporter
VFGLASFISPWVYSYLVQNLGRGNGRDWFLRLLAGLTPRTLPWVSIYWIFAACSVVMIAITWLSRFPQVKRTEEEQAGTLDMYRKLLRNPMVWLFFGCVFAYVGSEQGTADWISKFLAQYHGFDPHTAGAAAVSWFWGLMTAGCFIGMGLLKLFDSRRVLIAFSVAAILCLTVALFSSAPVSVVAFPMIGLFASIMWPVLMSLGLNSVAEYHGSFAGILCTGIMGGAVVPLIIGRLGDLFGLRAGMAFLYLTFGCVLSAGFWAKPLITNATIGDKKAAVQPAL